MHQVADLLNKADDAAHYEELFAARRQHFNDTYFDPATGRTAFNGRLIDTQTSYAVPLALGLLDEHNKERAIQHLVDCIERENRADDKTLLPSYSLMTGFIGTAWISNALSEAGRTDVAYRLLMQTSYPSWLYPVTQGATSIWERLNSYTHTDGFGKNNSMNSFNHYSFGAVGEWMITHSLGVRIGTPCGEPHFILAPEPDPTGALTYASGYYDSPYGRIESNWRIVGDSIHYRFVVPANTSATLRLPSVRPYGLHTAPAPIELPSGTHTLALAFRPSAAADLQFPLAADLRFVINNL
jgi:alpha-L-rhamnosidase